MNKSPLLKRIVSLITLFAFIGSSNIAFAARTKGVKWDPSEDVDIERVVNKNPKVEISEEDPVENGLANNLPTLGDNQPSKDKEGLSEEDSSTRRQREDNENSVQDPGSQKKIKTDLMMVPAEEKPSAPPSPLYYMLVPSEGAPPGSSGARHAFIKWVVSHTSEYPYLVEGESFYNNLTWTSIGCARLVGDMRTQLKYRTRWALVQDLFTQKTLHTGMPAVRDLVRDPKLLSEKDLSADVGNSKSIDTGVVVALSEGKDWYVRSLCIFSALFPLLKKAREAGTTPENWAALKRVVRPGEYFWSSLYDDYNTIKFKSLMLYSTSLQNGLKELFKLPDDAPQTPDIVKAISRIIASFVHVLLRASKEEVMVVEDNHSLLTKILHIGALCYDRSYTSYWTKAKQPLLVELKCLVACFLRSGFINDILNDQAQLKCFVEAYDINDWSQRPSIEQRVARLERISGVLVTLTNVCPSFVKTAQFSSLLSVIQYGELPIGYQNNDLLRLIGKSKKDCSIFIREFCKANQFDKVKDETKELLAAIVCPVEAYLSSWSIQGAEEYYQWNRTFLDYKDAGAFPWFVYFKDRAQNKQKFIAHAFHRLLDCHSKNFQQYYSILSDEEVPFAFENAQGAPYTFKATCEKSLRILLPLERDGKKVFSLSDTDENGNTLLSEICSRKKAALLENMLKYILKQDGGRQLLHVKNHKGQLPIDVFIQASGEHLQTQIRQNMLKLLQDSMKPKPEKKKRKK